MRYDPGYLRGPLLALLAVAACLAVLALGLRPVFAVRPGWLPAEDRTMYFAGYPMVGARLAGAARQIDAPRPRVLLGSSTSECAFDPRLLESPERWHSLHGPGPNLQDLDSLAALTFRTVHPDLLVLAVNPGMLAASQHFLDDDTSLSPAPLAAHLAARQAGRAARDIDALAAAPAHRVFPERTRTREHLKLRTFDARLDFFGRLGISPAGLFPPDPSAWIEPGWASAPSTPESFHEEQLAGWAKKGWFEAGNYSAHGANAQAFLRLVERTQASDCRLLVVLMPESTRLRAQLPPAAIETLQGVLESLPPERRPDVLDLHSALPDADFHDLIHLNPAGRRKASQRLAEHLAKQGAAER